ncbi:MAG: hypothetical protein HY360_14655 [Verrucomicrobia bacterium]|nr:hypothetical protein [Verrucomicrobiota bacterium]
MKTEIIKGRDRLVRSIQNNFKALGFPASIYPDGPNGPYVRVEISTANGAAKRQLVVDPLNEATIKLYAPLCNLPDIVDAEEFMRCLEGGLHLGKFVLEDNRLVSLVAIQLVGDGISVKLAERMVEFTMAACRLCVKKLQDAKKIEVESARKAAVSKLLAERHFTAPEQLCLN